MTHLLLTEIMGKRFYLYFLPVISINKCRLCVCASVVHITWSREIKYLFDNLLTIRGRQIVLNKVDHHHIIKFVCMHAVENGDGNY